MGADGFFVQVGGVRARGFVRRGYRRQDDDAGRAGFDQGRRRAVGGFQPRGVVVRPDQDLPPFQRRVVGVGGLTAAAAIGGGHPAGFGNGVGGRLALAKRDRRLAVIHAPELYPVAGRRTFRAGEVVLGILALAAFVGADLANGAVNPHGVQGRPAIVSVIGGHPAGRFGLDFDHQAGFDDGFPKLLVPVLAADIAVDGGPLVVIQPQRRGGIAVAAPPAVAVQRAGKHQLALDQLRAKGGGKGFQAGRGRGRRGVGMGHWGNAQTGGLAVRGND